MFKHCKSVRGSSLARRNVKSHVEAPQSPYYADYVLVSKVTLSIVHTLMNNTPQDNETLPGCRVLTPFP